MSELLDDIVFFGKKESDFRKLQYPLKLTFKIGTIANDFIIEDASGQPVGYVRQKLLKLIDEVQVFTDSSKKELAFTIKANKWIDFSATYTFANRKGEELGRVARRGWKSIWKARYDIFDEHAQPAFHIQEENPWAKVWDGLAGDIPVLSLFTGYIFHPKYAVKDQVGNTVMRLKKEPSFFGRKFSVSKELESLPPDAEERIILSLMMMILLERKRG